VDAPDEAAEPVASDEPASGISAELEERLAPHAALPDKAAAETANTTNFSRGVIETSMPGTSSGHRYTLLANAERKDAQN
jgi:hypothetical protein